MVKEVLLTGGLGFIGSHTALSLLEEGYKVVLIDNLDNAFPEVYSRMQKLAGDKASQMTFVKGDLRFPADLEDVFSAHKFDSVIHFAGRKAVGESVEHPMLYYTHNLVGAVNLIEAMRKHDVKNIVFSSSCTVYGNPQYVPIDEKHPLKAVSPYGRTKLMIEEIFRDLYASEKDWKIILLRYFNPVGAHSSGEIGEHPVGIPNNLMPYIQQVALGQREALSVYGTDYNTRDGTAIRDYIHVVDLARGHVKAIEWLAKHPEGACDVFNLGTGTPRSVMEMLRGFERACGKSLKFEVGPRRVGDIPSTYATVDKARDILGWTATKTLDDMCADAWRWQSKNPMGMIDAEAEAK